MIDFTTIQANPIPPTIIELQNANTTLQGKNSTLKNILVVIGVVGGLFMISKVTKYIQEERIRKNNGNFQEFK